MKCDGYSDDDLRRATELRILVNGYSLYGVAPKPGQPSPEHESEWPTMWVHTIGLSHQGLPELVMAEVEYRAAAELVGDLARRLIRGHTLASGCRAWGATMGSVHPEQLRGRVFWGWSNHYGREPDEVEWVQIFPPPNWFCAEHGHRAVPLDRPGAPEPVLRRPSIARNRADRRRR